MGAYEYDAAAFEDPFDVDTDGNRGAADIQLVVNNALGTMTLAKADVNQDGASDAIDVQLIINAVLGLG
jgi:hypothetical protein